MDKETYIQKHLHQELSIKEEKEFQLMMESDLDLKEEVKILTNLNAVNKKTELEHIKSVLYEAESEGASPGNRKVGKTNNYWKPLLVFLLILTICITFFYLLKVELKSDTLYASYYKAPSNTFYPLVRDGVEGDFALKKAFQAYEQKNYDEAENLLNALPDYEDKPEIQFYHAISLLEIGNVLEAKTRLETIKTEDEYLLNEIEWFKIMIAIKSGNLEEAQDVLNANSLDQKSIKWQNLLKEI